MAETALRLPVGNGATLEARLQDGPGGLAVLAHPHPAYGGDMDNNVVLAARDALFAAGFGALRFNFRGGDPDPDDLAVVLGHAADRSDGAPPHLVAYSYGAWIALKTLRTPRPLASLVLVAPPVDFLSFADLGLPDVPCRVVVGERDEFCSQRGLDRWLAAQKVAVDLERLPAADHFFRGHEAILGRLVAELVAERR